MYALYIIDNNNKGINFHLYETIVYTYVHIKINRYVGYGKSEWLEQKKKNIRLENLENLGSIDQSGSWIIFMIELVGILTYGTSSHYLSDM